jgi:MraZ protein
VFIGKYDRSLDPKGRLVLPSNYRRPFEDTGGVLAKWDRCLALWTTDKYGDVMEQLNEKVRAGEADDDVARVFQSSAAEVQLDSQGRFVITEEQRGYAGITREVAVIGQTTRVEIWSDTQYDQVERAVGPEAVSSELRRLRIV